MDKMHRRETDPTEFGKLLESTRDVNEEDGSDYRGFQQHPAGYVEPEVPDVVDDVSPEDARDAFEKLAAYGTDEEIVAVWRLLPLEAYEEFKEFKEFM